MSLRFQFHNAMHAFFPQDIRRYFATVFNCDSAMQSMHFSRQICPGTKGQYLNKKLRNVFPISKTQVYSHLDHNLLMPYL